MADRLEEPTDAFGRSYREIGLLLPMAESATDKEYLSKSAGISAHRLPFCGGSVLKEAKVPVVRKVSVSAVL